MKNGSKDFSAFLHEVRGPKSKFGSTAGFSKKKSVLAIFDFLGSKWPKIKVFATLWENGSNDFAHFAYLDRSHQYLQLFYWHQVLEKSSRAFRGHFRSKFWVFSKKIFSKIEIFQKKIFFSFFRFFSFWVEKCKKSFFSHCEVRSPET